MQQIAVKPILNISKDLQQVIGVSHEHIMRSLANLVTESAEKIYLIASKDLVVTQKYVEEAILKEVEENLNENGSVKLAAVAAKHGVPLQFVITHVELSDTFFRKDSEQSSCKIENDVLISIELEQNQIKKLLVRLQEIQAPTTIDSMASDFDISSEKLVSMIKEHSLGKIYQGKLFLPSEYLSQTQESLVDQFTSTGILAIHEFKKLYLPGGSLSSSQICQSLRLENESGFTRVQDYIFSQPHMVKLQEEFARATEFIDLSELEDRMLLPSGLVDFDALLSNFDGSFVVIPDSTFACRREYIQTFIDGFKNLTEELVLQRVRSGEKPKSAEPPKMEKKESQGGRKKGGGKGGKKGKKHNLEEEMKNEEDIATKMLTGMIEQVLSKEDIESYLASLQPMFLEEEDPQSLLLEPLAVFLGKPLNQQYNKMFAEVYERHSTKGNVNLNQDTEKELEIKIQRM